MLTIYKNLGSMVRYHKVELSLTSIPEKFKNKKNEK